MNLINIFCQIHPDHYILHIAVLSASWLSDHHFGHCDAFWGGRQPPHLTELGTRDEALLSAELNDLLAEEFDLGLIGLSESELDKLLAFVPEEDGDEGGAGGSVPPVTIPEPLRNPASRRDDLWILGDHWLLCGDSTSAADVRRLMNGERVILIANDPPYLVDYDGSNHPTCNKDWSASYGTTWDDSS